MCGCVGVGGGGFVGADAIHSENKMSPPSDRSEPGNSAAALALEG